VVFINFPIVGGLIAAGIWMVLVEPDGAVATPCTTITAVVARRG
jgi:hypothetical protein